MNTIYTTYSVDSAWEGELDPNDPYLQRYYLRPDQRATLSGTSTLFSTAAWVLKGCQNCADPSHSRTNPITVRAASYGEINQISPAEKHAVVHLLSSRGGDLMGSSNESNIGRVLDSVTDSPGSLVRVDAMPFVGYEFTGFAQSGPSIFSGAGSLLYNGPWTTYVVAGKNAIAAALFQEKEEYSLDLKPDGDDVPCSGYVTVEPAMKYYLPGTWVTLEATALPGYEFVEWAGDPETWHHGTWRYGPEITFTMDRDYFVRAVFKETLFLDGKDEVLPTLRASDLARFNPPWTNETVTVNVFTQDDDELVVFTAEAVGGTGGHVVTGGYHPTPRPAGSFSATTVSQNGENCFEHRAIYTPSEFAGTVNITATYKGSVIRNDSLRVRVPGLVSLGPNPSYTIIGQTTPHPDNVYVMPVVQAALESIAAEYVAAYPNQAPIQNGLRGVAYNDCSLTWGGRFDISGAWTGSHSSHRVGLTTDFEDSVVSHLSALVAIIASHGGDAKPHDGTHYHIEFDLSEMGQ